MQELNNNKTKICSVCGDEKDRQEFRPQGRKCKACQTKEHYQWRKKNPEKDKAISLRYAEKHRKEKSEVAKKWRRDNPERSKMNSKKWHEKVKHTEREAQRQRNKQAKNRSTPKGNLSSTVSKRMNESLKKGMKAGRHWESLVDFTVDQLKAHLEKLFQPGMSWDNRDQWHIDHKIPVSAFNYQSPSDIDFKRCWALSNLQPMWKIENLIKHNKLTKPFQPSLAIAV